MSALPQTNPREFTARAVADMVRMMEWQRERRRIIMRMSPREIEDYLSIGGVLPHGMPVHQHPAESRLP